MRTDSQSEQSDCTIRYTDLPLLFFFFEIHMSLQDFRSTFLCISIGVRTERGWAYISSQSIAINKLGRINFIDGSILAPSPTLKDHSELRTIHLYLVVYMAIWTIIFIKRVFTRSDFN